MVHADVEIEHDEDRGLQPVGEIERLRRELERLGRVFREQQHVLGVAMRGIGRLMMSHCWVRVGMPVEGPARCTSMITAGISAK